MVTPSNATASATYAAAVPSRLLETRNLMLIALPLAAAYLAEFAIALTTKSVVGQLGYLELAAIGLATDMTSEMIVVLVGLLSVVGVLVAQAEGAERKADAGLGHQNTNNTSRMWSR